MLPILLLLAAAEPVLHTGCETATEETLRLTREKAEIDRTIGDIAMGRTRKKPKNGGAAAARAVAGTAASVLLPFPLGAAINAGAGAVAKSGRKAKPHPNGPDVPALLARGDAIDTRLRNLATCG